MENAARLPQRTPCAHRDMLQKLMDNASRCPQLSPTATILLLLLLIYIYFFIGRALGARVPPCGWETHLHMIPPHVSSVCVAPRSASPVFLRRILPAQLGSGSSRRGCPVNPLRAACPPSGATFCVGCPYPPCGVPLSRVPAGCTDGAHKYRPRDWLSCGLKRGAALPMSCTRY